MAKLNDEKIKELLRESELLSLFDEMPEDFERFVTEDILPTYIFYNGKKGTGYCTTCHSEYKIKGLKHKAVATCPICGRKGTARSEGMSRQKYEIYWGAVVQKKENKVLVRYFRNITNYKDYRNPEIKTDELFRNVYDGNKLDRFMYWYDEKAFRYNWIEANDNQFGYMGMGYVECRTSTFYVPEEVAVYNGGFLEEFARSLGDEFKYAPVREVLEIALATRRKYVPELEFNNVLHLLSKYPFIERLIKVGLSSLVACIVRDEKLTKYFGKNTTEVIKDLKLDRPRYDILLSVDKPSVDDLRMLQKNPGISKSDFFKLKLLNPYIGRREWVGRALQYSSIEKVYQYAQSYKMLNDRFYNNQAGNDWNDYIGFCEQLGRDLHDESNLFPKDLATAHDNAYKQIRMERDKNIDTLIKKAKKDKENFKPFTLHYGGLFIKVAGSAEELKREGNALHHCVYTYADRVAEGKTTILFVRKESEPDTPYFTMEWKGEIVQLRGNHNCAPSKDVLDFRREFEKACKEALTTNTQAKAA